MKSGHNVPEWCQEFDGGKAEKKGKTFNFHSFYLMKDYEDKYFKTELLKK